MKTLHHLRTDAAEAIAIAHDKARRMATYRPVVMIATMFLMPAMAHAQTVSGGTSPTTILDNIATFILGPFGEIIAVLAIIGVGIAFMLGRAGLSLIGGVIGGLVLIFGASFLVTTFVGGG